jgi:hypothetical protein
VKPAWLTSLVARELKTVHQLELHPAKENSTFAQQGWVVVATHVLDLASEAQERREKASVSRADQSSYVVRCTCADSRTAFSIASD